jgi:hypothetical protein
MLNAERVTSVQILFRREANDFLKVLAPSPSRGGDLIIKLCHALAPQA